MTGVERNYKERQREWVRCPEYGKDLERGSLSAHFQTRHGVVRGGLGLEVEVEGGVHKPRIYKMVFPNNLGLRY